MVKVFITDDHYVIVKGIGYLLSKEPDMELVGSVATVEECKIFMKKNLPDVLLLDVDLPDGNGIDLCRILKIKYPSLYIIGISSLDDPYHVKAMMNNGASGFLSKDINPRKLIKAIRTVNSGGTFIQINHFTCPVNGSESVVDEQKKPSLGLRNFGQFSLKDGIVFALKKTLLLISLPWMTLYRR